MTTDILAKYMPVPMGSAEMTMTPSQERALEYAVRCVFNSMSLRRAAGYQLRSLVLEADGRGGIWMSMTVDNGKPGTFGFAYPSNAHLHIGRMGGYRAYTYKKNGKTVRREGRDALIFCQMR